MSYFIGFLLSVLLFVLLAALRERVRPKSEDRYAGLVIEPGTQEELDEYLERITMEKRR